MMSEELKHNREVLALPADLRSKIFPEHSIPNIIFCPQQLHDVSMNSSFDTLDSDCCLSGGSSSGLYDYTASTPRPPAGPFLSSFLYRSSELKCGRLPFSLIYNLLTSSVNNYLRRRGKIDT